MNDSRDMYLFFIGEKRVDGWQSPWGKDFEQYMKEKQEKARIKPPVKPKPVKAVKQPKTKPAPRTCSKCSTRILQHNKTGLCAVHYSKSFYSSKNGATPTCKECPAPIYRDNRTGLCRVHAKPYYRDLKRAQRLKVAA